MKRSKTASTAQRQTLKKLATTIERNLESRSFNSQKPQSSDRNYLHINAIALASPHTSFDPLDPPNLNHNKTRKNQNFILRQAPPNTRRGTQIRPTDLKHRILIVLLQQPLLLFPKPLDLLLDPSVFLKLCICLGGKLWLLCLRHNDFSCFSG